MSQINSERTTIMNEKKAFYNEIDKYVEKCLLQAQQRGEPQDQLDWIKNILPKLFKSENGTSTKEHSD